MNRLTFLCYALMLMMNSSLHAHQDTQLKLENGMIKGLPEKYLPATFDIQKQSLSIAGKTLVFPKVLRDLFTYDANPGPFGSKPSKKIEAHPYTYTFSASWYHGQLAGDLPPYMLITVTPPGAKIGFKLLIDMDNLSFLQADMMVASIGSVPIDLDGVPDKIQTGEQADTEQPANPAKSKSEVDDKPQSKTEEH